MTDESSQRAEARARARKRRTKGFERREAIFDLFLSGFSHQQIAKALGTSPGAVRRVVDRAVAERRLDAPERHVRVQAARLMKALSHADYKLEKGDIRAFGPYLKILAELDRYHGLSPASPPPRLARSEHASLAPPPLALTHAAPPLAPDSGPGAADPAAQPLEVAHDVADAELLAAAKDSLLGA